jgi:hypothetical protein
MAFGGGLTVNYSIPVELNFTQARFDVIELDPTQLDNITAGIVIMTVELPPVAFGVGEFTLECGALDTAGRYRVRLQATSDGPEAAVAVAQTGLLTVVWPKLTVNVPQTHGALEGPVNVTVVAPPVAGNELRCDSQHVGVGYAVQTVYLGRTETKNGVRVMLPRKVFFFTFYD